MKAIIYSNENKIGEADLEIGDISMGGLFGNFVPNEIYFEKIRSHVWRFGEVQKPDYKTWENLNFNVQLDNGIFLLPVGGITFEDFRTLKDEPIRIDIAGVDSNIIQKYFVNNLQLTSIKLPWSTLSIKQKLAFEEELKTEIFRPNSLFNPFAKKPEQHILYQSKFSAFCHDTRSDDVLFEIHNPKLEAQFALVHLTWSQKSENGNFPITQLFEDFDSLLHKYLSAENIDW